MRLVTGAVCALSAAAFAVPISDPLRQIAAALRDSVRQEDGAARIARDLSDRVGPRLAGSGGSRAARTWALATMRELGFENVHEEKLLEPRWVRGVESAEVESPVRQTLAVTALGGSGSTPSRGIAGVVVPVRDVEALAALVARDPRAVRDRVVFFTGKMERTRDGAGYGRAVSIRVRGPSEARRAGAAAALIRSVSTSSSRLPHTGATAVDAGAPFPAAALSVPDAELLERLSAAGPVTLRLTLGCRTEPDVEGANVVGELRGSERPDEIVVLGAHLDAWDLGTGAIDDAAGVGVVCDALRAIGGLPKRPRRTVRVVLFANEENGGRGAKAYVEAHRSEMERHVAALEIDLGTDRVYRISSLAGAGAEDEIAGMRALLAPLGVSESADATEGGADTGLLRPFGVPLIELDQDATRYFDFHHSADDTFDKVDAENLAQVSAATAVVAYVAADSPATLGRIPDEKRKVRER